MLIHFGTIPACDRRTDRHAMTAYTALSLCCAVKTDAARITKRDVQMFRNECRKALYFGVSRSKVEVRSRVTKKQCRCGSLHSCECWLLLLTWADQPRVEPTTAWWCVDCHAGVSVISLFAGGNRRLHADAVSRQQSGEQDHGVLLQDLWSRLPPRTSQCSRHRYVLRCREALSLVWSRSGSVRTAAVMLTTSAVTKLIHQPIMHAHAPCGPGAIPPPLFYHSPPFTLSFSIFYFSTCSGCRWPRHIVTIVVFVCHKACLLTYLLTYLLWDFSNRSWKLKWNESIYNQKKRLWLFVHCTAELGYLIVHSPCIIYLALVLLDSI